MRNVVLLTFVGAFLFFVAMPNAPNSGALYGQRRIATSTETVFTIPVGDEGVHYEGEGKPEMLRWGPAALAMAPDGSFWIADTAGNRLLHYDPSGRKLGAIDIEGSVVGAADLEIDSGGDVLVLDRSVSIPKVVRFAAYGHLIDSYEMPEGIRNEDGLTGIALGEGGEILAQARARTYRFAGPGGLVDLKEVPGYARGGKVYRTRLSGMRSGQRSRGLVDAGEEQVEVTVKQKLGGVRFLGATGDGTFFVVVDELASGPKIIVDQTVRRYDASGSLSGVARVPLSERYTYVEHGLALGPDGEVYALVTKPDRAEVRRLRFLQSLKPILPSRSEVSADPDLTPQVATDSTCTVGDPISRGDMIRMASDYRTHTYPYSSSDVNGSCSGRGKPRFFNDGVYDPGVPYDWGGWDTLAQFDEKLGRNETTYRAGDVDTVNPTGTDGIEACSVGVDCSGFVSRVWKTGGRCRTSDIHLVSQQISEWEWMQPGDILNHPSVPGDIGHVVLFWSWNGDSRQICAYESTMYNSNDRVIWQCHESADRFDGYVARRYNRVKDDDATFLPQLVHSYDGSDSVAYVVNGSGAIQNMLFTFLLPDGRTRWNRHYFDSTLNWFFYVDTTWAGADGAAMVRGNGAAVVAEHRRESGEVDEDNGFVNLIYGAVNGGGDPNVDHTGTKLFAPAVYSNSYGVSSTLNLQNVTRDPASVSITFLGRPGYGDKSVGRYTIQPFATRKIEAEDVMPQGWVGSAVIESDKSLAAHVFEDGLGNTRTYNAAKGGDKSANLYLPAMYNDAWGFTSGLIVQNIDTKDANVRLRLRDRGGNIIKNGAVDYFSLGLVKPGRALGQWLGLLPGFPRGWTGSVQIYNAEGARLAAVANNTRNGTVGYSYNAMSLKAKIMYLPRARKGSWGTTGYTVLNRSDSYAAHVWAYYYCVEEKNGKYVLTLKKSFRFAIPKSGVQGFHQSTDDLPDNWYGFIVLVSEDQPFMAMMRLDRPDGVAGYSGFRPIQATR